MCRESLKLVRNKTIVITFIFQQFRILVHRLLIQVVHYVSLSHFPNCVCLPHLLLFFHDLLCPDLQHLQPLTHTFIHLLSPLPRPAHQLGSPVHWLDHMCIGASTRGPEISLRLEYLARYAPPSAAELGKGWVYTGLFITSAITWRIAVLTVTIIRLSVLNDMPIASNLIS